MTGIFLWPLARAIAARGESFCLFLTPSSFSPSSFCIHGSTGFCARTVGRGVRLLLLPRAGRRVHQLRKGERRDTRAGNSVGVRRRRRGGDPIKKHSETKYRWHDEAGLPRLFSRVLPSFARRCHQETSNVTTHWRQTRPRRERSEMPPLQQAWSPSRSLSFTIFSPSSSLQAVYSRVARICKSDRGGPNKYKRSWTSYLKSRLNCSLPGEYPFYFDHLRK